MEKNSIFTVKMTVSIGCIPVVAVFRCDQQGMLPRQMTYKSAVATSSLDESSSTTSMRCTLSPGQYCVSFGLKETKSGHMQIRLFASSPLQFYFPVCIKHVKTLGGVEQLESDLSKGKRVQKPISHVPDL